MAELVGEAADRERGNLNQIRYLDSGCDMRLDVGGLGLRIRPVQVPGHSGGNSIRHAEGVLKPRGEQPATLWDLESERVGQSTPGSKSQVPGRGGYINRNPDIPPVEGFFGATEGCGGAGSTGAGPSSGTRTLQVVQVGQRKIFTEMAASRAIGPSIDIRKSFGVLVGDHGRLTVIEHFDMHRAQTSISMASLHREVDGSWGLRWSVNLLVENPQSFLGTLLLWMFLPDEDVHPTTGVSAPGTTNTVCKLAVPDEASVTIRHSTGVVIGDHARVRTRIERVSTPHASAKR